jgi:hypothetical protein
MWIKNGAAAGRSIVLDGKRIFNPTDELYVAAGYEWIEPPTPEPSAEPLYYDAVDKELFITAVTSLVPAEAIPAALSDAETAKAAIAGMMYMTTDAAPDNTVYLDDPRVAQWLAISGVTVELVKMKMEELEDYGK